MGNLGASYKRAPSRCNFCGSVERLCCYPTDIPSVGLIRDEDWVAFIDRIVAAFAALQPIPEEERVLFREELENRLRALNSFCSCPA